MSNPSTSPFEVAIARGEALRRMVGGVSARLGRRAEDAECPEIVQVKRLFDLCQDWDRSNVAMIRSTIVAPEPFVERYLAVARPDRQLFITDFGTVRARAADGITEKLALLQALDDAFVANDSCGVLPFVEQIRPHRVFIGHGRTPDWRELKDFVHERLGLPIDEFDRESVAGKTIEGRLSTMLERCTLGLVVMTPENEHADGSMHARENVIHEIGRAQGKLGTERTIVLVQDGCAPFSNLDGTLQLPFAPSAISSRFEDVRRVLEREGALRRLAA